MNLKRWYKRQIRDWYAAYERYTATLVRAKLDPEWAKSSECALKISNAHTCQEQSRRAVGYYGMKLREIYEREAKEAKTQQNKKKH